MSTVVLDSAMGNDGSTECLNYLLEAGSNRNAPDGVRFASFLIVGRCLMEH
jgi:hypothetical protein